MFVEQTLDFCIKCNICVTECPVAAVTDKFPGPKYEGPQAARFRQPNQPLTDFSVDYCSGCRVCNMVCPTGVRIAEINARARAEMVRKGAFGWRTRLRNNLLARSELLGKVGQPIAPLANALLQNPLGRLAAELTGIPIVGTSTSCTLTLKEEAPELLDAFDEESRLVAEQTFDLSEFLLNLHARGELNTGFRPINLRAVYHPPCQYRAHRVGHPSLELLRLIPGLEIVESRAACCGIAGTYGFKVEKYEIAMQVGQPLFEMVRATGGPIAICDSETCRWQITHGSGVPSVHPMELLALAYGYEPEGVLQQQTL